MSTTTTTTPYADWKAPGQDGQTLVWPEPAALLRQTRENHRQLAASEARVQGVPLGEVRRRLRAFLGFPAEQFLFATGHQTELYHPGVWVKDVLIDALAQKTGGVAAHFAVDTDEPKHLHLRWPGAVEPITDDPRLATAAWSGQVDGPTPAHLNGLIETLERARGGWSFEPMLGQFLASLRPMLLDDPSLPRIITNAQHQLDWELGLRHHALIASPLWLAEPFLLFAYHLMARADGLATAYNASLAEYRTEQGIKSPGRPMPDLRLDGDACESPFWCDDLAAGTRTRASLRRVDGRWALVVAPHDGGAFRFDPSAGPEDAASLLALFLRRNNLRLSPRALTLTTFLRLCVVDQFVHGIGGGRYDQVTDRLLQKFFGVRPPAFSVTTATLIFPEAVGRQRACVSCVVAEGRRIAHDALGAEKQAYVRRISELPRKSLDRALAFTEMQRRRKEAAAPLLAEWEPRLRATMAREAEERTLFDRELFYPIQPRTRLERLIADYRAAVAGA